jgi:hypothetical protein
MGTDEEALRWGTATAAGVTVRGAGRRRNTHTGVEVRAQPYRFAMSSSNILYSRLAVIYR